jgi:hypothetical protein
LAINQIAKNDDVICYLEGNNNQMVLLKNNAELKDIIDDYSIDNRDDLNIETALKLMGFKTSSIISDNNHLDTKIINKFIVEYKKIVKLLIKMNTKMIEEDAIKELKLLQVNNKNEIEKVIRWGYGQNKSTPFGFILEEMTYHLINNSKYIKNIMELKTNVRLYADEQNRQLDEFDIALLTKNGKFMIFECKSGGMGGDVAKSTKYSTYAVSGAYGLPILITPLLQDDIDIIDDLDKDIYGYIQSAYKSAIRAGLDVWGLDKIEDRLKKYIEL